MSEDIIIIEKATVAIEEIVITVETAVVIARNRSYHKGSSSDRRNRYNHRGSSSSDRHYKRSPFGGSNYYKRRGRSSS